MIDQAAGKRTQFLWMKRLGPVAGIEADARR
jgi:hypothetical protein